MAHAKCRINLANFTIHIGQISLAQNVDEIVWRNFVCARDFLLGAQMLVKSTPDVNFTNILLAAFASLLFCQKIIKPNCNYRKASKNTLIQQRCSQSVD